MRLPLILFLNGSLLFAAVRLRVTTSQYDNMRSGANENESVLSPRNVNAHQFGKVLSIPVDGDVYAQPLYLSNVDVPGKGVHNLLFVATEHDSVYAFDVDKGSAEIVWHVNLLAKTGIVTTVPDVDVRCPFISPEVGITSTPVIDTTTGTLYVLARTKKSQSRWNATYSQHLHALAITTGVEKFGGPIEIRASASGDGGGSSAGAVQFDALRENPRAALLLSNNSVYLTWASSCDVGPYHGWVMAYDARTLQQQAVFNTSPDSAESGIWQSDTGPAADQQGNVYVVTGNGEFNAGVGKGRDYGDTALRLTLKGNQLVVTGSFTPFNQEELDKTDGDLGSGGPVLLPGPSKARAIGLVFGGKAGVRYVVNPERMGGQQRNGQDTAAQTARLSTGIYSAPAYWNGHLYYFTSDDSLKEFVVKDGSVSNTPESQSTERSKYSGGTPTVSSNGARGGIVWVIETKAWNGGRDTAILRAYDALDVSKELYSNEQNPSRDTAGQALRFAIPMVANGRVFVGVKKAVEVYGLVAK